MPIRTIGFVEQRWLKIMDIGLISATDAAGCSAMTVSVSAILWRNPDNKSDPVNLAEPYETTRRAVEDIPFGASRLLEIVDSTGESAVDRIRARVILTDVQ